MKISFPLIVLVVVAIAEANVPFPDGWTLEGSFPYGRCTNKPIAGLEKTGPPYTGANSDPYIAEAVGSGSQGTTCSFTESISSNLPPVWQSHYLLAASQDLYAGHHLRVASTGNKNSLWVQDCQVNQFTKEQAEAGLGMCSNTCGECFSISGPKNVSSIWIVNEISDVNCCGQAGEGFLFNLDNRHVNEVRLWGGFSKDIMWKRVPCPTTSGIKVLFSGNWGVTAVYLTILNHAVGIAKVHARGGVGATSNTEWTPLVRDWTNRWHWESYGCGTCVSFQSGPIHGNAPAGDFQLKITSRDGQEVICVGLPSDGAQGTVRECLNASSTAQQFHSIASINATKACDGSDVTTPDDHSLQQGDVSLAPQIKGSSFVVCMICAIAIVWMS